MALDLLFISLDGSRLRVTLAVIGSPFATADRLYCSHRDL